MKKIKSKKIILKTKKKKILATLLLIIITAIGTSVKAGIQDSTLIKNRIEGIYAVAPLSDKTHLYYLQRYTLNGKISYCIELGKDITTDIYNSETNSEEQEKITKLNKEKLDYIKALAYFGYGYKNHNDDKYYMATQELIWEYLNNIDITWTNTLDINGPKIDIETYKNEIKTQAQQYLTLLSISTKITGNMGEITTISDNILPQYNVIPGLFQYAEIKDNTLKIHALQNFIGNDTIKLIRKKEYSYPATIYNYEDSQIIISAGNLEDIEKTITFTSLGANLNIKIIDKDTNSNIPLGQAILSDNQYQICDNYGGCFLKFNPNSEGLITISNLYYDTFYIKQIKPGTGYLKNEKQYKIKIDTLEKNLTIIEEVIKKDLEINKLYEINSEYQREADITFEIYDNNNTLYNTITTSKYGPDIISLPYGKYIIKQQNTTYGYNKVKDIELNIDEDKDPIIKYDLIDEKIKVALEINTLNKDTQNLITEENIKYKIKRKNDNVYLNYQNSYEFSTNKEGNLLLPIKLEYGEYEIEQATTPKNYLENSEKVLISINDQTNYIYNEDEIKVSINYYNEPYIGKINIITNEEIITINNNHLETNTNPRKNIDLELYKENMLIDSFQTDNAGSLTIDNLELGNYCIKEKQENIEKCINLIPENKTKKIIEQTLYLTKEEPTTNIKINNIDINGYPIEGTIIEIEYQNSLIDKHQTNEEGIISLKNMPKGEYCLKQEKINNKYLLNENKECFIIDDTKEQKEITIINKIRTQKIEIPNTISNISYKAVLLPIAIIILLGGIKNKKNNMHS